MLRTVQQTVEQKGKVRSRTDTFDSRREAVVASATPTTKVRAMRVAALCLASVVFTSCAGKARDFAGREDSTTGSDSKSSSDSISSGDSRSSGADDGPSSTDGETNRTSEPNGTGDTRGPIEDCSGCLIDGECLTAGATNPENDCEVCDPEAGRRAWTANDGRTCSDGLYCTEDDRCRDGECIGETRDCDDGVECNGVSVCNEDADRCTEPVTTCVDSLCDLDLDTCVTNCNGCIISGQCVPEGAESPDNACLVCTPGESRDAYSPAVGKSCGSDVDVACNAADTCDENGECAANESDDGAQCEDESYCSESSVCRSGQCVPMADRVCPNANERCEEASQSCVCDGCLVDGTCYAEWASDPNDVCFICMPDVKRDAFVPGETVRCGDAATECSQQDTCDGSGMCRVNHEPDGTECAEGACYEGECYPLQSPFDCIAPSPPAADFPMDVYGATGSAPVGAGGRIVDGRYVPVRIDIYSPTVSTLSVRTFEFRRGYVQAAHQPYSTSGAGFIPQIEFSGTYSTSGGAITFDMERCDPNYDIDIPALSYTVSANGLVLIETVSDGAVVTSYRRE